MTASQLAGFIAIFALSLIPASIWVGSFLGDFLGASKRTRAAMSVTAAIAVAYGAVFESSYRPSANDCADLMRGHGTRQYAEQRCAADAQEKAPGEDPGASIAAGPAARLREVLAHDS